MRIVETDANGKEQVKTRGSPEDRFAIDIPLELLRRDSDGDGLTDIVEESLLLNPHSRDSDGDGIPDAEDAFPNLDNRTSNDLAGPMAEALDAIVNGPMRRPGDAVSIHTKAGAQSLAPSGIERPLIFFTDSRALTGVGADRFVLVFSRADLRKLEQRRGHISGTTLESPVVNRARDRGYIKYDNGLTGGTIAWRRENGGWKAQEIRSFIR
jgi:hypothetical protein